MFNLFQQTDEPTIICALPDGGRVPRFLRGHGWAFRGKVDQIRSDQFASDKLSVDAMIHRNGYYIYTRI